MPVKSLDWEAWIFDKRDRIGIPTPNDRKFSEIFDLDYICEKAGGEKVGKIRLPFAPIIHGQLDDHAETLYKFEWGLVHNVVRGYHPIWHTTIYTDDDAQQPDVAQHFSAYFGKAPQLNILPERDLNHVRATILEQMAQRKDRYDNSEVSRILEDLMKPIHMY